MSQEEALNTNNTGGAAAEPKSKIWSVIGASSIMLTGMLVAAVSYVPIYMAMEKYSGWDPATP